MSNIIQNSQRVGLKVAVMIKRTRNSFLANEADELTNDQLLVALGNFEDKFVTRTGKTADFQTFVLEH